MKRNAKIILILILIILIITVLIITCIKVYQNVKYFKFTAIILDIRANDERILVGQSNAEALRGGLCYVMLHGTKITNNKNKRISINDLQKGDEVMITMSINEPFMGTDPPVLQNTIALQVISNKK